LIRIKEQGPDGAIADLGQDFAQFRPALAEAL
jgi:hypothetical protein